VFQGLKKYFISVHEVIHEKTRGCTSNPGEEGEAEVKRGGDIIRDPSLLSPSLQTFAGKKCIIKPTWVPPPSCHVLFQETGEAYLDEIRKAGELRGRALFIPFYPGHRKKFRRGSQSGGETHFPRKKSKPRETESSPSPTGKNF